MRKLPRDLVLILRTEAKNQRTPPIDYVIAEDGRRMALRPGPDIAMAELLEEAAAALEAQAAELAAVKEMYAREGAKALYELERADRAEAQLAEARKALEEAREVVDACAGGNRPARSWAITVRDGIDASLAARRALTGGHEDG